MTAPPPRISVLLPVRDGMPFLPESVQSVLAADFPLELVAVDDGSSDGSGNYLDETARKDPRLRVIHTRKLGIVAALNRALGAAQAALIARQDADDCSLPGRFAALARHFDRHPQLALAGSGVGSHAQAATGAGMLRYQGWINGIQDEDIPREIWVESPLVHPSIAARREVLLACGGYRDGRFPEDYELLLRLHSLGHRLGKVHRVWYLWRDHPTRLTRTDPRYALDAHRALKARYLCSGPLRGHHRVVVWGAGRTGKAVARALFREGVSVAAWIEVDPRKIGRSLYGAPVLGIDSLAAISGRPMVVAVGVAEARPLIRAELAVRGHLELRDYWVLA